MEVFLFFVLVYAAKRAWDDARQGAAKSRKAYMKRAAKKYPGMPRRQASRHALKHDIGHALSQAFRGFPNARHGFAAGWHEGRQAHAHARAGHQRAKAEHLETRASLVPDLTGYRERQKAALERIRRGTGPAVKAACSHAPAPCLAPDSCPCACPDCMYAYAFRGEQEEAACKHAPGACLTPTACPCDCPGCMAAFSAQWEPPQEGSEERQPTRRADGLPETEADKKFFDLRESGYTGPIDRNGNIPDPSDPEDARMLDVLDGLGNASSPTEGTPMASEVTYDGVIRAAGEAVTAAEERAAEIARTTSAAEAQATEAGIAQRWADQAAENMQALNVDPATLSAMADHQDALTAAEKAHQEAIEALQRVAQAQGRVTETAQNVKGTLERGHAGLKQAHDDAPVDAADREFYQD